MITDTKTKIEPGYLGIKSSVRVLESNDFRSDGVNLKSASEYFGLKCSVRKVELPRFGSKETMRETVCADFQ